MAKSPFLLLPPFTPAEGEVILAVIVDAMTGLQRLRDLDDELRLAIDEKLAVLCSLRTAFAEAIANHERHG